MQAQEWLTPFPTRATMYTFVWSDPVFVLVFSTILTSYCFLLPTVLPLTPSPFPVIIICLTVLFLCSLHCYISDYPFLQSVQKVVLRHSLCHTPLLEPARSATSPLKRQQPIARYVGYVWLATTTIVCGLANVWQRAIADGIGLLCWLHWQVLGSCWWVS